MLEHDKDGTAIGLGPDHVILALDIGDLRVIMPKSRTSSNRAWNTFRSSSAIWEVAMGLLELCDAEAAVVSVEASVADAVRTMLELHVGAVAVVDSDRRVAGIFTERDILRKFALSRRDPESTLVRELMTPAVELATAETGASEALVTMVERHFRHLPVVDNQGRLLGMLSIRNLLQWRIDDLSRELGSLEQYVSNDSPGGD
jgi:CBS domain-containing protein